MPTLTLHVHPLSSCCQKVLIAADELEVELDRRLVNLGDADERRDFLSLWPTGKIPLLMAQTEGASAHPVPETSIIIEYLQRHRPPSARPLIPEDFDEALEVRLWDRLFDLYVMHPMQACTAELLKSEARRDALAAQRARETLLNSYAMVDAQLAGRTWVAGRAFSMADCAAAPALFYARTYVPFGASHQHLASYFERLLERPSVASVIEQAAPFFRFYPGRAGLERRFFDPEAT